MKIGEEEYTGMQLDRLHFSVEVFVVEERFLRISPSTFAPLIQV